MKKIYLNRIYVLDTGASLIMVYTKEFTEDGVICEFKQQWAGKVLEVYYELFEKNGYTK
jgi:hypothetical protein